MIPGKLHNSKKSGKNQATSSVGIGIDRPRLEIWPRPELLKFECRIRGRDRGRV